MRARAGSSDGSSEPAPIASDVRGINEPNRSYSKDEAATASNEGSASANGTLGRWYMLVVSNVRAGRSGVLCG